MSPPDAQGDLGTKVVIVAIACVFLATLSAALRLYVRITIVKQFGYDDWAAAVTWVLLLGCGITIAIGTRYGLGRHIHALDKADIETWWKLMACNIVLYQLTLSAVKAAFLLQYRRCLPLPTLQRVCDILLVFVLLWGLASALTVICTCIPASLDWPNLQPLQCLNRLIFWYINSAINIVTDIVIYCLPIPLLKTLRVGKLQKAVLLGIFCIGFFTCVISVIRIFSLRKTKSIVDQTWHTAIPAIWSTAELCCAVVCLCVPTLRPLLRLCGGSSPTRIGSSENAFRRNEGWSHVASLGEGQELSEAPGGHNSRRRSQADSETGVPSTTTSPVPSRDICQSPPIKSRPRVDSIVAGHDTPT